jgi:ribosome-binding factor A
MRHRVERVNNLILEELSKIIAKEIEFPSTGSGQSPALVTLTEVSVSENMDEALVRFSVLSSDRAEEVLKILNKNLRHLQHLLLKKINIKPMPKIRFEIDRGLEMAAMVEKKLLDIEKGGGG